MKIKYELISGRLFLYLVGELDEHHAKGVKEYIEQLIDDNNQITAVVFNLSELTFMDSTGIGMLLGRYKKLKRLEIPCYIQNPTSSVEKVLELSGIYEVMTRM